LGTDFFQQIIDDNNIPTEWKIWQRNEREQTTAAEAYAGATYDTKYVYESPFNDVIQWDRELAMTGCLPDTYPKFLQELGHSKANVNRIKQTISHKLREHLKTMLKTYWRITTKPKELKGKRKTNRNPNNDDPNPTQNSAAEPPLPPPGGGGG
jgi:hypothetical protein